MSQPSDQPRSYINLSGPDTKMDPIDDLIVKLQAWETESPSVRHALDTIARPGTETLHDAIERVLEDARHEPKKFIRILKPLAMVCKQKDRRERLESLLLDIRAFCRSVQHDDTFRECMRQLSVETKPLDDAETMSDGASEGTMQARSLSQDPSGQSSHCV